ncbi:hypothetical protein D3C79_943410 [compost metagenome]
MHEERPHAAAKQIQPDFRFVSAGFWRNFDPAAAGYPVFGGSRHAEPQLSARSLKAGLLLMCFKIVGSMFQYDADIGGCIRLLQIEALEQNDLAPYVQAEQAVIIQEHTPHSF